MSATETLQWVSLVKIISILSQRISWPDAITKQFFSERNMPAPYKQLINEIIKRDKLAEQINKFD